ncbi:SAM-dependent methyltransferase [Alkalibacter rhizosphaerae]|uniref:SAM-dependent methyltransferase n=1 Tax=Alkalibacter rhizosphaerae TaxID=2815577 RepID=A0A974XHK7_9FIRM|nr:class I SAM-dependent methyltransferase [Alkalibacter rhizosphaerae]QSX08880.1 SAM-dependent methyltransferase [Alkalibacter rhizosphaerae]
MKLTDRLQQVANYVKPGSVVADIGTDHGYLAVYLIKNNISPYVYASDVNQGPLNSAREQVRQQGLVHRIGLALSHGADRLKDHAIDQVVIAGMGGGLIAEIIENDLPFFQRVDSMILQPMTGQHDLRRYLLEKGFVIVDEDLAKEKHRLYQILLVTHGKDQKLEKWSNEELRLGKRILEKGHPLLPALLKKEEDKWNTILHQCEKKNTMEAKMRWEEAKSMLTALEEVKRRDHLRRYFTNN